LKQLIHNYILCASVVLLLFSCSSSVDSKKNDETTGIIEKEFSYPNADLIITKSDSKTNFLSAKASIENMFLIFEIDLSKVNKQLFPISKNNDTLCNTLFNIDFSCNQQSIPMTLSKKNIVGFTEIDWKHNQILYSHLQVENKI
jgi:hypothetical protein